MTYSDQELESLLSDIESDTSERKESWKGDAPTKGRQAVCAFANDLPGRGRPGVLFVGVADNGTPTGLDVSDELLRSLADMKTDGKIVPPPSLVVEKRRLLGQDVAVVFVTPSDSPPVRFEGRVWIRTGPRRSIASAQEERILSEKRQAGDRPFDSRECLGSTVNDLNLEFFKQTYLSSAVARDVLEANGRTLPEQLSSLKLSVSGASGGMTHAGILTCGKDPTSFIPGSYVQFVKFNGDSLSSTIADSVMISGRIDEIIRQTEDKFKSHNTASVTIATEDQELSLYQYPLSAFQQVFRNAVMHRTYESTNTPIRIYWFENRIEIHSPGGPFGSVTPENFGQPGVTDYRNPTIAEAMRNLGYAQRFGVGISLASEAMRNNGGQTLTHEVSASFTMFSLNQSS